jgi:gluconokinase
MTTAVPPLVVVCGPTASGKTTVGLALARRFEVEYGDADDFHPAGNIAKMRAGEPLTEADRVPWLTAIGEWLADRANVGAVASCSALRRAHRDRLLRAAPTATFLMLAGDEAMLRSRLRQREDHFMPESLLQSQLDAFEPLAPDEPGVVVDAGTPTNTAIDCFLRWHAGRVGDSGCLDTRNR